jgi:hypothetical protein
LGSVGKHVEKPVPAAQAANAAVSSSDTAADLATAGTVTFSNPVLDLGAVSGFSRTPGLPPW